METVSPTLTVRNLLGTRSADLRNLYLGSTATRIPNGYAPGTSALYTGTARARTLARIAAVFWQGKFIDAPRGEVVNQWFGMELFKASVYLGESWVDGGQSLIIDYEGKSRLFRAWRDEIREVAPGLWLGIVHRRPAAPGLAPRFLWHILLETD